MMDGDKRRRCEHGFVAITRLMNYRLLVIYVGFLAGTDVARAQAPGSHGFVPAVAWKDTVARCETPTGGMLSPDERGFLLRFGKADSAGRVVTAVWDTIGHLRRYSDARGDLRGPGVSASQRGDRTTIVIDIVKGMALLMNDQRGSAGKASMMTAASALDDASLGPPRQMLARMHVQCGAPLLTERKGDGDY